MAFGVGSPGPEQHDESILADINVTPLVDVMLVLLIIFMVTAPMLHQGVEVALPRADAEPLPLRTEDPVVLSVNRDGLVYLQDTPIHPTQVAERLRPILEARGDDTVFLKGDRNVEYGRVIEVLDVLHQAGITRVGMITERPEAGGGGPEP